MSTALPPTCEACGEKLTADGQCPYGHPQANLMETLLRAMDKPAAGGAPPPAAPAPKPPPARSPTPPPMPSSATSRVQSTGTAAYATVVRDLAAQLAAARNNGYKIIVNVGQSGAGKSWLIARMGKMRGGTFSAMLYSPRGAPQVHKPMTGRYLTRTLRDEFYIWDLVPGSESEGRACRSGRWKIVDIAGELVSNLNFINEITRGQVLYDLLTMALAHASALVFVIDGDALTREKHGKLPKGMYNGSIDEHNEEMLNDVVRLTRFLHHQGAKAGPPMDLMQLETLKESIRQNPGLTVDSANSMLSVPVLLMVSKADAVPELHVGSDPLRYGRQRLPLMHGRAVQNIRVCRWAAAAPFEGHQVEEPADAPEGQPSPRDVLNYGLPSRGVLQALDWLDNELQAGRWHATGLSARRAISPWRRWLPYRRLRSARR